MSAADPPNPDDPIDDFIRRMKRTGKGKNTIKNYKTALNYHLRSYLDRTGTAAAEMTRYDCEEFLDEMKADPDLGTESVEGYAIKIRNFYSYYNDRGTFEVNPMKLAMDDYDFGDPGDDFKREISVDEMREFVQSIHHPLVLAIVVLFLKTGIRVGELCNIDMRDVYIDDPRVMELWPEHRTELEGKPDSIYIERRGVMHIGAVVNGENRTESNKRIRSTVIPIDEELKKVLMLWLAVRPESRSPAEPLLSRTVPGPEDSRIGDRLSSGIVSRLVRERTKPWGWWEKGATVSMNVTPHYFRHFFTTHMRMRTSDTVFGQFIRGDTGDKAIDDYTHNWGDKVREKYLQHIYNFF